MISPHDDDGDDDDDDDDDDGDDDGSEYRMVVGGRTRYYHSTNVGHERGVVLGANHHDCTTLPHSLQR